MYNRFIQVGDTFKAEQESIHFHRGMTYQVSHVFNDKGQFRIFISDKNGFDIEYKEYFFKPTAKTVSASDDRQKRAKLDFFWNNSNFKFVINSLYYNADKKETISFNKYSTYSAQYKGPQADISRRGIDGLIEGSKAVIRSAEDLYVYFKGIETERITIEGIFYTNQEDIDHVQYMLSIPHFDETLLKIPSILDMMEINQFVHNNPMRIEDFLSLVGSVIFDESELSNDNKKIILKVMEAFELLPKSYGPTAASKLLMGKEKKENKTVKHLSGTCTTLKQPQMFTLCDIVESYLYVNNIFVRKDEYSSGDEWRGAYEFIGSKMIELDELARVKNYLR